MKLSGNFNSFRKTSKIKLPPKRDALFMIADCDVKQDVRRYVGNGQVWTWVQNDAEQRLNAEFFKYKG